MNISTTHKGIAASALLLALATAAPSFGQAPPTNKPQDRGQQGSTPQGQGTGLGEGQRAQQGMEQIGSAYRQLHQVTLSTLQDKARGWKEKPAAGTTRSTDSNPGSPSSAMSTAMSLRGDELLIAACTKGLLAGAPSTSTGNSTGGDARKPSTPLGDERNQGTQPNSDKQDQTSGSAGSELRSVGMILVHAHTSGTTADMDPIGGNNPSNDRDTREASGDRDSAPRNAASGNVGARALKPGVYCVKQTGSSVWLTDQEGQTVLRTTLDSPLAGKSPKAGELGGQQRETGSDSLRTANQGEWEQVFGAITKEAMSSMGWVKQGTVASTR
ncbi:MAG: hypothetical protein JNN27_14280 [Planctomycetes bacterium]|nr:hypothetical protein [Planctomycetota bacterium]